MIQGVSIVLNKEVVDWKKGDTIIFELSENSSWVVTKDNTPLNSSEGSSKGSFKIEGVGSYEILANGVSVVSPVLIEKKSFWNKIPFFRKSGSKTGLSKFSTATF